MKSFSKQFEVRWADLDPNFHMRHSSYCDYAAHVRFAYLTENGFPLEKFQELSFGPVLFSEKIDYMKEVKAGESITVDLVLQERSQDFRKYAIVHRIFKIDGTKAAEITVTGAWFDTQTRKVIVPPLELQKVIEAFPRISS